jgi:DNA-binding LacI/PurR family transcriptional regulator
LYYQVVAINPTLPKHERIRRDLAEAIASGRYGPGARLPSESELVGQFGASRPTVIRALRELQQAGLIVRRAGSGSYVRVESSSSTPAFGLLIPQLGNTEIFEPICRGMAQAQPAGHHVLLWGSGMEESTSTDAEVSRLCEQFLAKRVAGVFFAPLELTPSKDTVNRRVADLFRKANIPMVLIDRDLVAYPARSDYDLVGIDNRRAGYTIAAHLLSCGARRLVFVCRPGSAPTVDARIAGCREAMLDARIAFHPEFVCRIDPSNTREVAALLKRFRPDGIVCANDFTAARLLKTLTELGARVPDRIRLAGIDDVRYASLLSVPLTTIHQPCDEMGATAIGVMEERLRCPALPARDVLLNFHLIVRESSGAKSQS